MSPAPVRIRYEAPPTLARFLDSSAFIRAVVGPVGSGKSSACVLEILRRAKEQTPGPDGIRRTRFAIIRNTYPQLRDTTRKTFEQWIPAALGEWNEQQLTFRMRFADVECEVLFRALDRPEDVKKLLSLELTGAYINEAREVPKHVFDVLQSRVGRYPSRAQGGASWFGVWMDTNPWHTGHWGYQLFSEKRPEEFELFEQPDGLAPEAENVENLPTGYYERLCNGKDSEWVDEYVRGKYPRHDKGSVWGDAIAALKDRGGILEFEHPKDGIFTSWDLGFTDATGIWFWRIGDNRLPDVVDHYEAHGKPLSHYFDILDSKGFTYARHWLPHDARARTLATGSSIQDQFEERYPGLATIGPGLSLLDGIQAARWLLEQPIRVHSRCKAGLLALGEYRYEYDEAAQAFKKKPLHNFASHSADAWRYLACVVKATDLMTRREVPPPPPKVRSLYDFSLDELHDMQGPAPRSRV